MATLAKLLVELGMDPAKFNQGVEDAKTKLGNFGTKMTSVGKGMTAGITTPIVGFGIAAVNAASDLSESTSAVETVYGEAAANIKAMNGSVAETFGLSRQQALQYNATLGAILQGTGLNQQASAEMSDQILGMGADFASFYNAPIPEALQAIQSGLTGEYEPLKRFGVLLNDAAIEEAALAAGIWDGIEPLTEAQKVQARYLAIQKQMGPVAGDFSRTSEGLANQQKILTARFKDQIAVLGTQLLPIVLQFVEFLSKLMDRFSALSPATQRWILIGLALVAVLGPLLIFLGMMASALAAIIAIAPLVGTALTIMLGPWGLLIIAVIILAVLIYKHWGAIRDFIVAAITIIVDWIQQLISWWWGMSQGIADALSSAAVWIGEFIGSVITFFSELPGKIGDLIAGIITSIIEFVATVIEEVSGLGQKILDGLGDALSLLSGWGSDLIQGLVDGIWSKVGALKEAIQGVMDAGLDKVKSFWEFGSPSKVMEQRGIWAMEGFNQGAEKTPIQTPLTNQSALPFSGGTPGPMGGGGMVINLTEGAIRIDGSGDPEAVGEAVVDALLLRVQRVRTAGAPA